MADDSEASRDYFKRPLKLLKRKLRDNKRNTSKLNPDLDKSSESILQQDTSASRTEAATHPMVVKEDSSVQ